MQAAGVLVGPRLGLKAFSRREEPSTKPTEGMAFEVRFDHWAFPDNSKDVQPCACQPDGSDGVAGAETPL